MNVITGISAARIAAARTPAVQLPPAHPRMGFKALTPFAAAAAVVIAIAGAVTITLAAYRPAGGALIRILHTWRNVPH
ncbi:MAG: hypothetical protein JO345_13065 [Streptosporangiaceae bacterium]|nr:hypothetical protein [Streptosporangiaceae bacterium]